MEQLRRIAWLPIIWGVLTDMFLTTLMSQVVALALGIGLDTEPSTAEAILKASAFYWPSFLIGILFSGVGGFLAGRLAKREGAFHGTLTAFISNIVLGLLITGAPEDMVGMVGIMLAILAGTVGGWLATVGMKREA